MRRRRRCCSARWGPDLFHPKGPTFLELMKQALSSTDAGYDLLAPKFELTPFRTPDVLLEAAAKAVGKPVPRILDLCCGTGAGLRAFRPYCTEALVGVDRSAGMLAEARRLHGGPLFTVRGDAGAVPFRGSFDVVTCFGAFGHIVEDDEPQFVAQVKRALRPGGRFLFITSDPPPFLHPGRLMAHGFNAAMRVRNALLPSKFIMYYLTFLLPRARALLEAEGFEVETPENLLPPPFHGLRLVIATRSPT